MMTKPKSIDRDDRSPANVIEQAVWLSIRFPLSLRMVEDLLAARGIVVSHESGTPRVMVTDKPVSDGAARTGMDLNVEHRQHKGLNNRAEKPGKECASADAEAQEDHQAVHIRPTPEAPRLDPRSGRQPPQLFPPRHVVIRRSDASFRGDHRVGRDRRTGHRRVAPRDSAKGQRQGTAARDSAKGKRQGKAPRLRMAAVRHVDRTFQI
jgi:hypothetical protein